MAEAITIGIEVTCADCRMPCEEGNATSIEIKVAEDSDEEQYFGPFCLGCAEELAKSLRKAVARMRRVAAHGASKGGAR